MKPLRTMDSGKIGQKLRYQTTRVVIISILITALPLLALFSWSYLTDSVSQMNVISEQTIQQLNLNASNVMSYAYQVPNDYLLLSLLSEERSETNKSRIENRLMELCGNRLTILSCEEGNFHSVFIDDAEMNAVLNADWYQEIQKNGYVRFFCAPVDDANTYFYFTNLEDISPLSGNLIISIRSYDLSQILQTADAVFSHYIWLDNRGNVIFNREFTEEEYLFSMLSGPQKNNFFDSYLFYNSRGIFISQHSELSRWKFVAFIPYMEFIYPFLPILLVLLVSMALLVVITSSVLKPLIHNIVSPIKTLSEHMRNFSYETPCFVEIHTGDEIEELSSAFNQMSTELKKQVEMLLEEQKKEQKMKYGLQISQINPHFVYNTMNTITYLARKNRSEDIIIINNALIHIMKDSLRINESSVFDTVETEISVTEQYLKIQEYRYEETIQILWDVSPSVLDRLIPKHVIQPIVENAIIHGFLDDGFESVGQALPFIQICIAPLEERDGLCIRIEDNGVGIDMEKYERICREAEHFDASREYLRGKHIGLANIKYRLSYLLEKKQELIISPRSPHGTIVTIILLEN